MTVLSFYGQLILLNALRFHSYFGMWQYFPL